MNQAPFFTICAGDDGVKAIFGELPTRIYPYGQADEGVTRPYATWQVISGNPENYLADASNLDDYQIQVNVYAESDTTVIAGANAIMQAIQEHAYVLNYNGDGRDAQTSDFYFSFDVGWIVTG